jgi:hypothetical protein
MLSRKMSYSVSALAVVAILVATAARVRANGGCENLGGPTSCGSGTSGCVHSVTVTCGPHACTVTVTVTCNLPNPPGGTTDCTNQAQVDGSSNKGVGGCCGCTVTPKSPKTWNQVGNSCADFSQDCS